MQLALVIGDPIHHSLSPQIFTFFKEQLQHRVALPPFAYWPLQIPTQDLNAAKRLLDQLPLLGMNVTLPHKESVMSWVESLTLEAQVMGAINVMLVKKNQVNQGHQESHRSYLGHNTDAIGIERTLEDFGISVAGKKMAVIGAGGAARAALYTLGSMGASEVRVINRNLQKAQVLCEKFAQHFPQTLYTCKELSAQSLQLGGEGIAGVVQTTPLEMMKKGAIAPLPVAEELQVQVAPGTWALDLVYRPFETPFLKKIVEQGGVAVPGLWTFVWQAYETLELFFPQVASELSASEKKSLVQAALNFLRTL